MERAKIFTHRGLEPDKPDFYGESTFEAFQNHIQRGFGIEFDPNPLKDGYFVVTHDKGLARITSGKDTRLFTDLTLPEVKTLNLEKGHLATFEELTVLLLDSSAPLHALHFKGNLQKNPYIKALLGQIEDYPELVNRLLVFDVKPQVAREMKKINPRLILAPSVAHPYDIERYNDAVSGTLISVEDSIRYKHEGLYDWVWLDEWDTEDQDGGEKQLYTAETIFLLRSAGYQIALVTPELHGTSPGLSGGEAHPDAAPKERLFSRIRQIISLKPDAICTDHPEAFTDL